MSITKEIDITGYVRPSEVNPKHDIRAGIADNDVIFITICDITTGSPEYFEVSFSSTWIPEDNLNWFAGVLGMNIYSLFTNAQKSKARYIKRKRDEFIAVLL